MIFEKVKQIIIEQLGVSEDEIKADANFVDDLGADSLDVFQIVMAIEEEFDIEVAESDAERIKTVGDAVKYIESKTE